MWMREHQRPWTLGAIVASDAASLKRTLLAKLADGSYRRGWLVVGSDRGFWREERLCLRRGGTWAVLVDSPTRPPTEPAIEPRRPSHPELIPELEAAARRAIDADEIVEGTIKVRERGLLLVGVDAEANTMYGLGGYRDLLDLFWRIRTGRLARGTGLG
jgi:hypothetical protein